MRMVVAGRGCAVAVVLLCVVLIPGASSALAASQAPDWTIDSCAAPTDFSAYDNADCLSNLGNPPRTCDSYRITVTNAGSRPRNGEPVTLSDTLPAGLIVQRIEFFWSG